MDGDNFFHSAKGIEKLSGVMTRMSWEGAIEESVEVVEPAKRGYAA